MNQNVDAYFTEGCGRCPLGGTPGCKVHRWVPEMAYLRTLLLACGLTEESKWGVPCYTFQQANVVVLAAFKDYCALSFFKGALLNDEMRILTKPGEHTQSARLIPFTQLKTIAEQEATLRAYIYEAIEVERAGLKVDFDETSELVYCPEFQQQLDAHPDFAAAFHALTRGRQRAYNLYFSAPKKSETRASRIAKYMQQILDGKGLQG